VDAHHRGEQDPTTQRKKHKTIKQKKTGGATSEKQGPLEKNSQASKDKKKGRAREEIL